MRDIFRLFRFGATCLVVLLLVGGSGLRAQSAVEIPRKSSPAPVQPSQAELLESYRQLREQLRAAELAIVNNRLEVEAAASARTAAITEKFETLRLAMVTERERLQDEARRTAYEREQQQAAAQAMTHDVLRLVFVFGGAGLLALFAIVLLQWRGNRRMAEYATQLQSLPIPDRPDWAPVGNGAPGGENVALANQRLVSVLDRMERRVGELEQTVVPPAPIPVTNGGSDSLRKVAPNPTSSARKAAQIKALLDQGQSLLNAKKAVEALAHYDEILSLDANHAEALMKKGLALERLQKSDAALQYYDRAIEADRNLALAYIAKGGLFVRLERFEEAFECYEQAMQAGKTGNPTGVARVSVSADWPAKR